MVRIFLSLAIVAWVSNVEAAPKRKYYLELAAVTPKGSLGADEEKLATPRITTVVKAAFANHPQLLASLGAAPDWKTKADAFRVYLARKQVAAAYQVTVEITEASERIEPMDSKPGAQRLVVRVAIHMLGERMPDRTIGFTGDGQATVKVEIGKKLHERDRAFAWDDAVKAAVDDAMATVFKQLAVPVKKQ